MHLCPADAHPAVQALSREVGHLRDTARMSNDGSHAFLVSLVKARLLSVADDESSSHQAKTQAEVRDETTQHSLANKQQSRQPTAHVERSVSTPACRPPPSPPPPPRRSRNSARSSEVLLATPLEEEQLLVELQPACSPPKSPGRLARPASSSAPPSRPPPGLNRHKWRAVLARTARAEEEQAQRDAEEKAWRDSGSWVALSTLHCPEHLRPSQVVDVCRREAPLPPPPHEHLHHMDHRHHPAHHPAHHRHQERDDEVEEDPQEIYRRELASFQQQSAQTASSSEILTPLREAEAGGGWEGGVGTGVGMSSATGMSTSMEVEIREYVRDVRGGAHGAPAAAAEVEGTAREAGGAAVTPSSLGSCEAPSGATAMRAKAVAAAAEPEKAAKAAAGREDEATRGSAHGAADEERLPPNLQQQLPLSPTSSPPTPSPPGRAKLTSLRQAQRDSGRLLMQGMMARLEETTMAQRRRLLARLEEWREDAKTGADAKDQAISSSFERRLLRTNTNTTLMTDGTHTSTDSLPEVS